MRTSEAAVMIVVVLGVGCAKQPASESSPAPTPAPGGPGVEPKDREDLFVTVDVEEAARRLWPRPGPTAYAPANATERAALTELIGRMVTEPDATPRALAGEAAAAGYVVEGWILNGERVLAALEVTHGRRGGGAYLVRVGSTSPVILEAPHGFYDMGTERIGLEMFAAERGWPRALFVNTIHRYIGTDGVKRRQAESPADPCHSAEHLLAIATTAAVEKMPRAEVVQLHGFGEDDDEEGPAFAAIVSGGVAEVTPRSREVAAQLRGALGLPVGLYPVDTDRLGATTNVQGRAIRAYNERSGGAATFVHVEMSAAVRERLKSDAELRGRVAAALRASGS